MTWNITNMIFIPPQRDWGSLTMCRGHWRFEGIRVTSWKPLRHRSRVTADMYSFLTSLALARDIDFATGESITGWMASPPAFAKCSGHWQRSLSGEIQILSLLPSGNARSLGDGIIGFRCWLLQRAMFCRHQWLVICIQTHSDADVGTGHLKTFPEWVRPQARASYRSLPSQLKGIYICLEWWQFLLMEQ